MRVFRAVLTDVVLQTAEHVYKKTPQGKLRILLHFPPGWKASDRRPGILFFYVGIPDRCEGQIAPAEIGIEKMDMNAGQVQFLISLQNIVTVRGTYPDYPYDGTGLDSVD